MRKVYYDVAQRNSCISVFISNADAIPAGTTIYSMSAKDKNEEYERIEKSLDIKFIFSDNIPFVTFYTVPHVDIFAVTDDNGFLGTVGSTTDINIEAPICYINSKKEVFAAAYSLKNLLNCTEWKAKLKTDENVLIFESEDEAKKTLEFIDFCNYKIRNSCPQCTDGN